MRQIMLDTETTGFDPLTGDKIVEIGAVEMIKRKLTHNNYHQYVQPERNVPQEVIEIHGITNEFLVGKPTFREIADEFMEYISGAELIIHNAPFDIGFINHELSLMKNNRWGKLEDHCTVVDSLRMARKMYPGQRNSLDALCRRLYVDNSNRTLHGALLDSEILADVYLMMTGGQTNLSLAAGDGEESDVGYTASKISRDRLPLKILYAGDEELTRHQSKLAEISKKSGETLSW